jgi:hypothetical protein
MGMPCFFASSSFEALVQFDGGYFETIKFGMGHVGGLSSFPL